MFKTGRHFIEPEFDVATKCDNSESNTELHVLQDG
jgi:hypothetical protein